MNEQITALLWLFVYATVPVALLVWLKWRGARMVRSYLETERKAARSRLAKDADQRTRRAVWFSMLDQLYVRYTGLLDSSRGPKAGAKSAPSRRRA
jgi:hypothetical protein